MLIAFALVHLGSYQFMSSMANKSIDLNVQSGMAEHAKDIILLTTIIQALSLASGYFLVLWLLVSFSFSLRPRSHYSVFVSIRFCCIKATVHTAPFSYKNGEKNLRFCAFTLICSVYSVFVKLIVGYWSDFKNLRFCGYPLLTAFSRTSVFVALLCGSM